METFKIRAKVTDPIIFQCQQQVGNDAPPVPVDLTGVDAVELHARERTTGAVLTFKSSDVPPLIAVTDEDNGEVTFSPLATTFVAAAQYNGWLRVTDALGKIISYPTGEFFTLVVVEEF